MNGQDFDVLLSGSTLTAIVIMNDFIYSANVGDSKAILLKSKKSIPGIISEKPFEGEPFQMTVDHKPYDY